MGVPEYALFINASIFSPSILLIKAFNSAGILKSHLTGIAFLNSFSNSCALGNELL